MEKQSLTVLKKNLKCLALVDYQNKKMMPDLKKKEWWQYIWFFSTLKKDIIA